MSVRTSLRGISTLLALAALAAPPRTHAQATPAVAPSTAVPAGPAPVPVGPTPPPAPAASATNTPAPAQASSLSVAPEAPPSPSIAPLVAPPVAAQCAVSGPQSPLQVPVAPKLEELSRRLLDLERHQIELENQRQAIKVVGLQIGSIASMSVAGVLLYGAISAWGRAEQIKSESEKTDPDEKLFDTDDDGDVDADDETRPRKIARGLAIVSALPAVAGVVTTVMFRKRKRARSALTNQIEKLIPVRRAILKDIESELNVSGTQAGVDLRLRF